MAGRLPTDAELDALERAVADQALRSRGRMTCLRLAVPDGLDADALRALLADRLDGHHALHGCEIVTVRGASSLRVLGGFFR